MQNTLPEGNASTNKYINTSRIVTKPWGREIWLELNDKYCYKRIEITGGFKTSYQVHTYKLETNFIIKGNAEVWLENDDKVVEKFYMKEGDFFTVLPGRKHRVIAITDIILQEVSTPEVDDVIRINDEFNRSDGKINEEHSKPVVCILAAGTGSRLEHLSKTCHKALLPFKNKAILSEIIDKFDTTFEFVIAVGYLKDQIKEYIGLYHPERTVRFVDVIPFEGVGSGPAYSIESCRSELQRPFYFCVSDFYTETVIQNKNLSTENWIGVSKVTLPEQYSTIKITDGKVEDLINKSTNGYDNAFTGLFYMYDYKLFWSEFDKHVDSRKELVDIFKNIKVFNFVPKNINWYDLGTLNLYKRFISQNESANLYLHNTKHEFKYKKNSVFIKKIDSVNKIENLFQRNKYLSAYTPELLYKGHYFFSYKYIEGSTLYQLNNREVYLNFLSWFETKFCQPSFSVKDVSTLSNDAITFYKDKTYLRFNLFKQKMEFAHYDSVTKINNVDVYPMQHYLDRINWDEITQTVPTKLFHGDLQFDNIIYTGTDFKLIDWREDFGGNTVSGDLYYDLAKLNGGMDLNYSIMKDSANYSVDINTTTVQLDYTVDPILKSISINEFSSMVERNNLSLRKIKLLTGIIYLNMVPLHINNFDTFLFFRTKQIFQDYFSSV